MYKRKKESKYISLRNIYIQQLAPTTNKTTKKDSRTKEAQNPQNVHQTVLEYKLQLLVNINTVHQFEKVYHTNAKY